MRTNKSINIYLFAGISLFTVFGCKKLNQQGTDLQSLDNIENYESTGKYKVHKCGIENTDVSSFGKYVFADQSVNEINKNAAMRAISALPEKVKSGVFDGIKFKVKISAEAASVCSRAGSNKTKEFIDAANKDSNARICLTSENGQSLFLVSPDPDFIRSRLVRAVAYLLVDVVMPSYKTADPNLGVKVAQMEAELTKLVGSFESDMKNSKKQIPAKLQSIKNNNPVAYRNFIFAETFDSYYCSLESFTAAQGDGGERPGFPNTLKSFGQYFGVAYGNPQFQEFSNVNQ